MIKNLYLLICTIFICSFSVKAQVITTFAGTGTPGFSGDGGQAVAAQINGPTGVASDAANNIYIADFSNNVIRKVSPAGIITTIAGTGVPGYTGDLGLAISAELNGPYSMVMDGTGNLYISDDFNSVIRKISPSGIITTVAGTGVAGFSGDGGQATIAQINNPNGLAVDNSGNLYFAGDNRIRKIDTLTGIITTVAGNGTPTSAGDGGPATAAGIWGPSGVVVDASHNIFITDCFGNKIRRVDLGGTISTFAGFGTIGFSGDGGPATNAEFSDPTSLALDMSGNLIIGDQHNQRIRMITPGGIISSIAGNGTPGYSGDCFAATAAELNSPYGVAVDGSGFIYIADLANNRIRKISPSGLPVVSPIVGFSTVCVSSSIIVADITPGGMWTEVTGNASINPTGLVTGLVAGLDTIKYAVTNACGTTTATYPITVNTAPAVAPIAGPSVVCLGDSITLTDATTGGNWATLSGFAYVNPATGVVTGLSTGVETVQYSVANMCSVTTVSYAVSVNTVPTAGTITGPANICPASTITLFDPAPGGTWMVTNSNASVSSTGDVTGLALGIDTVMYVVSNTCGTDTARMVDTISLVPSAGTIVGPDNVCPGATMFVTDVVPGGTWGTIVGNATISAGGLVSGITAGVDTITYSVVLSCGAAMATYPITVNALTFAGTISGTSSLCVGASATLTETVGGGIWNVFVGHVSVTGFGNIHGVTAGPDSVFYTVFGICGPATVSHAVTINPLPDAGFISGPITVCEAATMTLTDFTPGGSWSEANTNASVSPTGVVTGVNPGTDDIRYIFINMCGSDTAVYPITVQPLPHAGTITGSPSVCVAATTILADLNPGGVWSATNADATISSGGAASGVVAGIDTIRYIMTNGCGIDTAKYPLIINPLPWMATLGGPAVVCLGDSVLMTADSTGGTWSVSNFDGYIAGTGYLTGITTGLDTVMYSMTNVCGTAVSPHPVLVKDVPLTPPVSGPSQVCVGATITLVDDSTAGGAWSKSNASANVTSGGVVSGVSTGGVIITYTRTNVCGSTFATQSVNVLTIPSAGTIVCPDTLCPRVLLQLTDASPGGVWTITNGFALLDATGNIDGLTEGLDTVVYTVTNICGSTNTTKEVYIRNFDVCDPAYVAPVTPGITSLDVYPNPNSGTFSLLLSSGIDEPALVTITSAVGEKITSLFTSTNKKIGVDIKVAPGIYFVNVTTQTGRYVTKIVVE